MTMRTKKISATAMSEVECTHISLVRRGANRQPIKIHKSEDGNKTMNKGMQSNLDLAGIGAKAIKSEEVSQPVILAAIVKKGEGERISGLLSEVDELNVVSVTVDEENDCDVVNFVEADQMDENCIVYKHDDNVAFIVGGVKSSTKKMEFWANSTSFKENIQKTAFFPNMREACYTLTDTIANIMYEGDDMEAVTKAEAEVTSFKEYVSELLQSLPVKVMKSIESIDFNKPAEPAAKDEGVVDAPVENTNDKQEPAEPAAKSEGDEPAAKTEGGEPAAKSEEGDAAPAAKTEGDDPAPAAKSEDEAPAWAVALTQKMEDMGTRLGQVEESVQATAKKADEAAEQIAESKSLVEKAEGIVTKARGTTLADAQGEEFDDDFIPDQNHSDELREAGIESY